MTPRREEELRESLDFNTHTEVVNYIFDSYNNGQKKQAVDHCNTCRNTYDSDTLAFHLAECADAWGTEKFIEILLYCGCPDVMIENIFYDYKRIDFDKAVSILSITPRV